MPASIIKKVKDFGAQDNLLGDFDFANRAWVLFEWNDDVVESSELLHEAEPSPAIPAELPGVLLAADQPLAAVEAAFLPREYAEAATATNADLLPFGLVTAGVSLLHQPQNMQSATVTATTASMVTTTA